MALDAPALPCGAQAAAALRAVAARLLERSRRAGALSAGGAASLEARLEGRVLRLTWRETGGPEADLGPEAALAVPYRARRLLESSGPCLVIEVPAATLAA